MMHFFHVIFGFRVSRFVNETLETNNIEQKIEDDEKLWKNFLFGSVL